jgi:hypothetical protein
VSSTESSVWQRRRAQASMASASSSVNPGWQLVSSGKSCSTRIACACAGGRCCQLSGACLSVERERVCQLSASVLLTVPFHHRFAASPPPGTKLVLPGGSSEHAVVVGPV